MKASDNSVTPPIRLADYQLPTWRVESAELLFDLGIDSSEVHSRLHLRSDLAQPLPLRLNGEGL